MVSVVGLSDGSSVEFSSMKLCCVHNNKTLFLGCCISSLVQNCYLSCLEETLCLTAAVHVLLVSLLMEKTRQL